MFCMFNIVYIADLYVYVLCIMYMSTWAFDFVGLSKKTLP